MRFRLKTLMLVMVILAAYFAYLAYYRPALRTVAYESAVVPATAQGKWFENLKKVDDSPYSYKLLTKDELTELRSQLSTLGKVICTDKSSIYMWPQQATSRHASRSLFLPVVDPAQGPNPARMPSSISGILAGFLGIRRAGQQIQLRVDMDAHLQMPQEREVYSPSAVVNYVEADGHLFYEGQAPRNGLVFIAPIGEHSFHVVLFEVDAEPQGTSTQQLPPVQK